MLVYIKEDTAPLKLRNPIFDGMYGSQHDVRLAFPSYVILRNNGAERNYLRSIFLYGNWKSDNYAWLFI